MNFLKDENAQNPLEIAFYLIMVVLTMAYLMLTMGTYIDAFLLEISGMDLQLSVWGQNMMIIGPLAWAKWMYLIPTIFIIIVMVWAVKSVIAKHQYTTQEQQYMNSDEEF